MSQSILEAFSIGILFLVLEGYALPSIAQVPSTPISGTENAIQRDNTHNTLLLVIGGLLIFQTLLIVGLQRSRVGHKRAKIELRHSQRELEQRIAERTNRLRTINNQLYDEIAKHEVTEELLQETQNYLNSIINSMPSILIGVTRQGYVTHWNTATEQASNILAKDALGRSLNEVYPDLAVNIETIQDAIDSGLPKINQDIQHGDGSDSKYTDLTVYPLISNEITGAVIRIDDVTMRVGIENLMVQNEKMMSLGELAAGMAHEINNPLSAILHGVQNIYRRTSKELEKNHEVALNNGISIDQIRQYMLDRDIFKFIDGIRDAGERSAKIVTSMLEFSRNNSRKHATVDIVELLEHSLDLSANMFELIAPVGMGELKIQKEFDSSIPSVSCSATEIQQVVLNLLRNASQAFFSDSYASTQTPVIIVRAKHQEDQVCFEVEDNGPGMTETVRKHIFEPFFTTKDVGEGTGLGLSVSYFIITEHHDGTIEVDSTPGKGTRFTIKLPLIKNTAEATVITIN